MRIRTIKPETWTSRDVADLPIAARITWIGLWNYADDEGRAMDDARLVKAAVWPLDDAIGAAEVEEHLTEIAKRNMIVRYDADGKPLLAVTNWTAHQKISHPTPSKYPPPPERSGKTPGRSRKTREASSPRARARNREQGTGNREQGTGNREQGEEISSSALDVQDSFQTFWDAYPRQTNGIKPERKHAEAQWARLTDEERGRALIAVGYYAAACANGTWAKHAFRWLRDRTFEDWQQPARRPRGPENIHAAGLRAAFDRGVFNDPEPPTPLRGLSS